ncbi:MAG: Ku protein [Chloroflexi bacterium]|nr:Ku protein [Chloroflexota bacterium]
MVTIPVRLMAATQDKDVAFHLLHKTDHSRIKLKKWCPVDDREVEQDELVRAYEVSKDQYVELTDEDLDQLPLPSKHTIELSAFVDAKDIDPIYYEKSYYLEPDETGLKPYALLVKVLEDKNMTGMATIAIRNKEQLCALRPQNGALAVETLFYPDEIRERDEDVPQVMVNDRELAMASSLVDALAEPFDPSKYHDHYREAVLALIESKAHGKEVVAPEGAPEAPQVGDLMSALRASVEAARQRKSGPSREEKPATKTTTREHKAASKASRGRKKAAA